MGCVMMRVCNLDTCPVGVATQNPELRKRFKGKPEYVENFMRFIAQELREYMAKLGVRTIDEMVGRSDLLKVKEDAKHRWQQRWICLRSCTTHMREKKECVTFSPEKSIRFPAGKNAG